MVNSIDHLSIYIVTLLKEFELVNEELQPLIIGLLPDINFRVKIY